MTAGPIASVVQGGSRGIRVERVVVRDATPPSAVPLRWSETGPSVVPCQTLVEVDLDISGSPAWGVASVTRYRNGREALHPFAADELSPWLGIDLLQGEPRPERAYEAATDSLRVILELGVLDALGRALGLPAAFLLGGVKAPTRPAYASTPSFENLPGYVACAEAAREAGFAAIKLHASGHPELDCEVIAKVRATVGDGVDLMWDAEHAYDLDGARTVGLALDRARFLWFEAPLPDDESLALARLARWISTPLVPGGLHERQPSAWAEEALAGVWGALRLDVTRMSSLDAALRLVRLAEGLGLPCEVQSFGYGLSGLANLQLGAATARCRFVEVPFPLGLLADGLCPGIDLVGGRARLPERPGLGHDLAPELVHAATRLVTEVVSAGSGSGTVATGR